MGKRTGTPTGTRTGGKTGEFNRGENHNMTFNRWVRLFERNADGDLARTPEGKLIVAVISQCAVDRFYRPCRNEARRYFSDGRMELHAGAVGLDAQFVRECLVKADHFRAKRA